MGAFDSDKTLGRGKIATEVFAPGEEFIVWERAATFEDITIPGNEEYGTTTKVVLVVSKMDTPDERIEVGLIGASADKIKDVDPKELPCVCSLVGFHSKQYDRDGTIINWVRDLTDEQAEALSETL